MSQNTDSSEKSTDSSEKSQESPTESKLSLVRQLFDETRAMASYSLSLGKDKSEGFINEIAQIAEFDYTSEFKESQLTAVACSNEELEKLIRNHALLAKIVDPATPGSLSLLEKQETRRQSFKWLGRTRLIQVLSALTVLAIISLIILLPQYNFGREDLNPIMEVVILAILSYIGASFLLLYQANEIAVQGRYDPKYGATYFNRILLGIISGILLAEVIPTPQSSGLEGNTQSDLPKILLALVGGFSANVLYRVLVRISETLESLFQGSLNARIEAQVQSKSLEQLNQSIEARKNIASKLVAMSTELPEQQKQEIAELATEIIKGNIIFSDVPTAPKK